MTDHPTLPFDDPEPPEEWRPVPRFEGLYIISDRGRVMSLQAGKRHGRILSAHAIGHPPDNLYLAVRLSRDGRRHNVYLHQAVAAVFIGPRPPGQIVRHGTGGQFDNSRPNLCYGTYSQNNGADRDRDGTQPRGERGNHSKLTTTAVREIRARHAAGGVTYVDLAAEYGVSKQALRSIVLRRHWKHVA